MTLAILQVVGGLVVLAWSADRFVLGAASVARLLGLSPLLIGMLIIGFGTSAPELVVSALASSAGNPELALGNAFGSNIANIALIVGVTALLTPIAVSRGITRIEVPILLGVIALAFVLLADGTLTRLDAIILLIGFAAFVARTIVTGLRDRGAAQANAAEAEEATLGTGAAWFWTIAGAVLLVVSSQFLVDGASFIASALGLSDLVIGLTVVAIGTSLPELASAVAAARKGESDLVLGNVIGSSLFNGLAVVGLAGVIAPTGVDPNILTRDLPVLAAVTLTLWLFGMAWRGTGRLTRIHGAIFVAIFVGYTTFLVVSAI